MNYYEKLPCGGLLTVTDDNWYIEYNFLPLELKSEMITFRIDSSEVDDHLTAINSKSNHFRF